MPTPVEDLFRRASALDEQDRATPAGLLLESLEHEIDEEVESAWREEIERRVREIDAEGVDLIPLQDVKEKLQKNLGGQHPD